jgi:1-phosphofructokinase family hexose kinase
MILTVTKNTTVDQTVFVKGFRKGHTQRATETFFSMGGKPAVASFILGELGIGSRALGFAAGATGERIKGMLQKRGVTVDFLPVGGESRVNMVIIDTDDGSMTTITTSTLEVTQAHIEALMAKVAGLLDDPAYDCMITGGTLPRAVPPSIYTDLIALAKRRGVPVIFDATDQNLPAGLLASPTYIKPNRHELAALVGYPIHTLEEAYRAGRSVLERHASAPIITLDADGALAVLPDRAYFIPPINVEVVSAAGAGDAVLAGLAASIHRRQPIEEGLRLGIATATAVLLRPGTGDCSRADVERFLPQVQLLPYP